MILSSLSFAHSISANAIGVNIRNFINRNGSLKMLLNTTTYNYDCEISNTL